MFCFSPSYFRWKKKIDLKFEFIYLQADFSNVEPVVLEGSQDSMFGISVITVGDLDLDGKQGKLISLSICDPVQQKGHLVGQVYSEIMSKTVCKI